MVFANHDNLVTKRKIHHANTSAKTHATAKLRQRHIPPSVVCNAQTDIYLEMKKLITLIVFVITFSPFVLPQLDCEYCLSEPMSFDSFLSFHNNGSFELVFESTTGDQILTGLLSHGNYIIRNDKILLFDIFNGYQMEFEISGQSIHSLRSLIYYKNKDFVLCGASYKHFPISTDNMKSSYKNELLIRKLMWPIKIPLKSGLYIGRDDSELQLDRTGYKMFIQDKVISIGTWRIENDELIFSDTALNHDFNGLIINNGLKIYFLPYKNGQLFFFEPYGRGRTILNKDIWELKVKNDQ